MSNLLTGRWLIDRRRFLRGVGAAIALPLLEAMVPRHAAAADAPGTDIPRRSVFIYLPSGVNVRTWQITSAGPDYVLSAPLAALQRHRAELTPISGLHHPGALGSAHQCVSVWLTGAKAGQEGAGARARNSISCDQVMAAHAGRHTRVPSLELALDGHTLAVNADGVPLWAEGDPRAVFQRLFGQDAGGPAAQRRRLERRQSVLDAVGGDGADFRRTLGHADRGKLDEYLIAVREVEQRVQRLDRWLEVPPPVLERGAGDHLRSDVPRTRVGEWYRMFYDLILLALRTDQTRVITVASADGGGPAISEIGLKQTRHELSHHNGDPEQMARLTRADTFIVEQFAGFLDRLATTNEGEARLLDRTMVLFGGGMSHGHSHGNANLPLLFAGGRALGVRHGSHLDFNLPVIGRYDLDDSAAFHRLCHQPADPQARLSNLLLTMIQRMGIAEERFADSTRTLHEIVA